MTPKDMRGSAAAKAVDAIYSDMFRPGEGHVWNAADLDVAANGRSVSFTGQCFAGTLEDGPSQAVYRLDLSDRSTTKVTLGRMFRHAPDGRTAHVESGDTGQAIVVTAPDGSPIARLYVAGRVESLNWSPSGRQLLILAADPGADVAGVEGGFAMRDVRDAAAWLPDVTASDAQDIWRRLYRWSESEAGLVAVTAPPLNIWEASWLGDASVIVVASDHHGEGSWYCASLRVIGLDDRAETARFVPADQLGLPAGSPCGSRWAAVHAFCSDRGIICGTLVIGEGGSAREVDLDEVEVTDLRWRDAEKLLFAGIREAETIVGELDIDTGRWRSLFASKSLTIGGWYPQAVPLGAQDALAVIESYDHPPAIARLTGEAPQIVLDLSPQQRPVVPGRLEHMRWQARDGRPVDGWLLLPDGPARNLPLFVDIHGGPVSAHRNRYAANLRAAAVLAKLGYAVLLPNPRGSSGRGQAFAKMVRGDMGGEDVHDYLTGIDQLTASGMVDGTRVAVSGTSYGGFMSAWLVATTRRFAAAVPISPVANWYSQHFASQIPWFDEAFLDGTPTAAGGQYFGRSPVFFATGATAPTLVLGGARDKNTPAGQAIELYGALAQAGATTALALYPLEGHSLRGHPAYLDSAARIVNWLETHMSCVLGSVKPDAPAVLERQTE